MKKVIGIVLGTIVIIGVLTTSIHVYADSSNSLNKKADVPAAKVTRSLKQVLVNKNGDEITGNPKYDHGAPDRDVTFEEMVPGKTYYSYVYDDTLTEEENYEQFVELGCKAMTEHMTKDFPKGEAKTPVISDKGIATSEGTTSIVD